MQIKRKIANRLLGYLYKSIHEEEILTWTGKTFVFRGKELTEAEVKDLQSQAQTILTLPLWQMTCEEMQFQTQDKMFKKAKTTDDLMFPKAVLHTLDVMNKKFTNIKNIKL